MHSSLTFRTAFAFVVLLAVSQTGCIFLPEVSHQPQFHNPFPQLQRVAILPFANQSNDPTVDGIAVANSYRTELQLIPGFEVMPVGVVDQFLKDNQIIIDQETNFSSLAKALGVDALIVGSVTDFESFYPPRMGLAVSWHAANEGFHPIPPGYGLPWGTPEEENIPDSLVFEAEFALARRQLETQTPIEMQPSPTIEEAAEAGVRLASKQTAQDRAGSGTEGQTEVLDTLPVPLRDSQETPLRPEQDSAELSRNQTSEPMPFLATENSSIQGSMTDGSGAYGAGLPSDWPDPRGFIPDPPSPQRPAFQKHGGPIMQLVQQYDGADSDLTAKLENYHSFRDDGRIGGWQGYLTRTRDFQRFCCYLHIAELLTARGGGSETRVVWQWPFDRYQE